MATTTLLTLNQIVGLFKQYSDSHYFIDEFGYGDTSELYTTKYNKYPLLHLSNSQVDLSINPNKLITPNYNFNILILDKINDMNNADVNGYANDNRQQILNDTLLTAQDTIQWLTTLNQYGIVLNEQSITIEQIMDETPDKLAGWMISVSIKVQLSNCSLPMDFQPTITTNCPPVLVKNSDGSYTVQVNSGGQLVLPDNTLTIGGDDYIIPSATDSIITINGLPIGAVTQSGYDFDIVVPVDTRTQIGYDRPRKPATTTYVKYDDGWKNINNQDPYIFNPTTEVMALADPNDWWKLLTLNAFGNNHRWTSINGGYYDRSTGQYKDVNGTVTTWEAEFSMGTNNTYIGYVIDHLTGIGWYTTRSGSLKYDPDIIAYIDGHNSSSTFGYNDWNIPSIEELRSITNIFGYRGNIAKQYGLNDSPYFNYPLSMWSSTVYYGNTAYNWTQPNATTLGYKNRTVTKQITAMMRYHYV